MGSENHPVRNVGIYRSLPTFDASITGLRAIVTGANGISGFHTMRVLLESAGRWGKVYALSRRPPPPAMMGLLTADQRSRVQHVAVDFLQPPDDIGAAMREAGVGADYVFFYSYLQPKPAADGPAAGHVWSNAEELVKVNTALWGNFLAAMEKADVKPRRILLQTGAKNYGVHIGRHRSPACESDPPPRHLEPNFYYPQYDLLFDYCKANDVGWNIICPAWVIGSVTNTQINALHPFAVYAAAQARKGEPLKFPSTFNVWQDERMHATARLTGYLSEWAVLEEKCKDQMFNAQDTSPLSWDRFFHELARWYGVAEGVVRPEADESKMHVMVGKSGKDTPMGYGPPVIYKSNFSFVDWAKQPENQKTWEEMMGSSNGQLTSNPFADPEENFQMGDVVLVPIATSNMNKARRLGWTGYVDTIESVFEMYKENAKLGMVPEMVVNEPNPMI